MRYQCDVDPTARPQTRDVDPTARSQTRDVDPTARPQTRDVDPTARSQTGNVNQKTCFRFLIFGFLLFLEEHTFVFGVRKYSFPPKKPPPPKKKMMTVESLGHMLNFGNATGPGPRELMNSVFRVFAGTLNARVTLFCALVALATVLTLCLVASDKAHECE
jgi:hypothetical protein